MGPDGVINKKDDVDYWLTEINWVGQEFKLVAFNFLAVLGDYVVKLIRHCDFQHHNVLAKANKY